MNLNQNVLSQVKKINWSNREKWLAENPGGKLLSTYAINNALQKPKDWAEMARKCSNNPNHEHFGKTVEEIQSIWSNKSNKGADRGNSLDDYIKAILTNTQIDISNFDDNLRKKCQQFDIFHATTLMKMSSYVGSEIWITSYEHGLSMRLDSLFTTLSDKQVVVFEWKSTEKMSMENRYERLLGPASHLENCDLNKYTIQTHLNRFALEELQLFDAVHTKIINFQTENVNLCKSFDYDREFIKDIIKFAREPK